MLDILCLINRGDILPANYEQIFSQIEGSDSRRNAYASIEGYMYQFELLLYHILISNTSSDPFDNNQTMNNWIFYVEAIEDYTRVIQTNDKVSLDIAQVKYHQSASRDGQYYETILWLYYNNLKAIGNNDIGNYSSRIFYYDNDTDDFDDISSILESAISAAQRNITLIQNDPSKKISKAASILNRINSLGSTVGDNQNNRDSFCRCTKFINTNLNRLNLAIAVKELIPTYFAVPLPIETIYDVLVMKLINDGKQKLGTTLSSLQSYIANMQIMPNVVYVELILQAVRYFCLVDLVNDVYDSTIDNELERIYEQIGNKIYNFLHRKLSDTNLRKSFYNTAIAYSSLNNTRMESKQEWEMFLQYSLQIKDFIIKLANIIYAFEAINSTNINLEEWFQIDNDIWVFLCPWEKRGNGILIADSVGYSIFNAIATISKKYENAEIKPKVWYFMRHSSGQAVLEYGKSGYQYKIDITKPDSNYLAIDKVEEKYFYLECMGCLEKDCYQNYICTEEIFKEGCVNGNG